MTAVLVLLALVAVAVGLYNLSQATMGVGLIAVACLLAVFARMNQAHNQREELLRYFRRRDGVPDPQSDQEVLGPTRGSTLQETWDKLRKG